jgi:hypothetical protein
MNERGGGNRLTGVETASPLTKLPPTHAAMPLLAALNMRQI